MRNSEYTRLYLVIAAGAVALVLCASLVAWFDPRLGLFTAAWIALVVALTLARPFPFAEWAAVIVGAAAIGAARLYFTGFGLQNLPPVALSALALVFSALVATIMRRQITQAVRQHQNDRNLIEELRVFDPETGLIRERFVAEVLRLEIVRSQRYHKEITVLIIQSANWDELVMHQGEDAAHTLLIQMSEILKSSLRDVDVPFLGKEQLGAILRETPVAGARVVSERLIRNFTRKVRLPARIGVAAFPHDGVTETELMGAAQAALQVALTAAQPVVFYEQVRGAVEAPPPDTAAAVVLEKSAPTEPETRAGSEDRTVLRIAGVPLGDTLEVTQKIETLARPALVRVIEYREGMLILHVEMSPTALQPVLVKAFSLAPGQIKVDEEAITVELNDPAPALNVPDGNMLNRE